MPTIYVFGGRTSATGAVDQVQKYLPWGFGTENIPPWSDDYSFQATCNQVDIWSPYFLRADQDQFAGPNKNFDPEIESRGPDPEGTLPTLPKALYGLMATKIQSGVDTPAPDFPNGPFSSIFLFGGVDSSGLVSNAMYRWDPTQAQVDDESVIETMTPMPSPRAYGKAVFIPGDELKIALVGGFDHNGIALNTVDVYTFDSLYNPTGGGWETYGGTLMEALEACGAGYNPGYAGEDWVLTFGGWTGGEYSYDMYTARLGSAGDQVLREPVVVVPRAYAGSTQAGSVPLTNLRASKGLGPVNFNRYYVFGGVDENGIESIVETISLP